MKYITLVLIVFLSLAMTNSFAFISERYPVDYPFTGGGHSESGSYSGHSTDLDTDGNWVKTTTNCPSSIVTCFSVSHGPGWIQFDFNGLTGPLPLDSNSLDCYQTYININDSLVSKFIGPYAP